MLRATSITLLAAALFTLAACGNVAGANQSPTPPPLPSAPPLSEEAQEALNQPTPTPPPPAPEAAAVQGVVLLSETFDDNDLAGWTVEDFSEGPDGPATWKAEGGEARQAGDALELPGVDTTYLFTGDPAATDYAISAAAYVSDPSRVGLIARKTGNNYYQVYLDVTADTTELILAAVENATTRELARTPVSVPTVARWLQLRLEVRGATITGSLDGETVVTAQDSALSAGQAGLQAVADATARFDNVIISE